MALRGWDSSVLGVMTCRQTSGHTKVPLSPAQQIESLYLIGWQHGRGTHLPPLEPGPHRMRLERDGVSPTPDPST